MKPKAPDYVAKVAQDKTMREGVESRLLGLLDYYNMWSVMVALAVHHGEQFKWSPENEQYVRPKGSPGKITTGLRDLLLTMEMHHGKAEGHGTRKVANDLAEEWQKMELWSDSGDSLRRHYLRLCRLGPTMSMVRTAFELVRLRLP